MHSRVGCFQGYKYERTQVDTSLGAASIHCVARKSDIGGLKADRSRTSMASCDCGHQQLRSSISIQYVDGYSRQSRGQNIYSYGYEYNSLIKKATLEKEEKQPFPSYLPQWLYMQHRQGIAIVSIAECSKVRPSSITLSIHMQGRTTESVKAFEK